jgi:hypothetical protein
MDVTVPTPDVDLPPPLDSRSDGRRCGDSGGEYGNCNDVDAHNQCCHGSLGGKIGRATTATAS